MTRSNTVAFCFAFGTKNTSLRNSSIVGTCTFRIYKDVIISSFQIADRFDFFFNKSILVFMC